MSQFTHPNATIQLRSHMAAVLAALATLVAAGAVALVLAIGNDGTTASSPNSTVIGPNESHIAAAVGSRTTPPPDESRIASSVSNGAPKQAAGPSESKIASSVVSAPPRHPPTKLLGPNDGRIASSPSTR